MTAPAPPNKNGVPPWLPRALMMVAWTVIAFAVAGWMFLQLRGLLVLLLISLFLALALEPAVNWLNKHRWPRGPATGAVMLGVATVAVVFFSVLGSMLVGQVLEFIDQVPAMSRGLLNWVNVTFNTRFAPDTLLSEITDATGLVDQYASSLAENAWGAGTTLLSLLFNGLTIALFTFYLTADGPRFRRTICSVLPPRTQREVLRAWEIAISKTGGYIYSRALLALVATLAHYVALVVLDVHYAFALALWVGVLSQFIPTVGTYIGGAVPVLVALMQGTWPALWMLVFVVVYQQFENYLLQPRITARTLDMHPAVAFGSVLAGAAILGVPGALLALPAGASMQAFLSVYIRRYQVAEHPLLDSTEPSADSGADADAGTAPPASAAGNEHARDGTAHGRRRDGTGSGPAPRAGQLLARWLAPVGAARATAVRSRRNAGQGSGNSDQDRPRR
ncbi:AI-2E family transporter [Streptomonospora wellingtoniae]|uniref:AI-2E family transporter n=1 Tax=Streptomonospora wellingtoniae TaxID=3075544 RepID=A0ABU2KZZ1_9ACTN|nr:AI-2E family transporter [Streptomonospora sp. DSM 45055]MDT0304736.1 AI-2E family transporter [Streptomonospora sp. DSM 45055]